MKKRTVLIALLLTVALSLSAGMQGTLSAAQASPQADAGACDSVDIYIYNSFNEQVFFDATNWTTRTRELGILEGREERHFTHAAGFFEFWANNYGSPDSWDASASRYLPGCSAAKVVIKRTPDGAQFTITVHEPGVK